jgi:hypothetical protein
VRTSWCVHYRGTGGKSESVSVQAGGHAGMQEACQNAGGHQAAEDWRAQ